MKTTTERNEVVSNAIVTFTDMSEVAFAGIERLSALNLNTARESLQQGVAASMSLAQIQGGKDQDNIQNSYSGAGGERVTAYMRDVQEILSETQSAYVDLIQKRMSSLNVNNAMSFRGMEVFAKIAQQTSDMTKANIRVATETTEKLVATTSQQGRKPA